MSVHGNTSNTMIYFSWNQRDGLTSLSSLQSHVCMVNKISVIKKNSKKKHENPPAGINVHAWILFCEDGFLKWSAIWNPNTPRGSSREAKPQQLPLFPVCLHILIAFHLDGDECVNAVSKMKGSQQLSSSVCLCVSLRHYPYTVCMSWCHSWTANNTIFGF